MVGRVVALDLSSQHDVTSADRDAGALSAVARAGIGTRTLDVSDSDALFEAVNDFDLVVGAVPGFLGFRTLESVIRAGKNIVDISFFPENALELQELAVERGVVAVVDSGVAPGLDNLILGHHDRTMDVRSFECLVGGLPKRRKWPFAYKAPFSPIDVIEEYTRPARYLENGHEIVRPALSDPELVWFEEVGTLESFNTDGLRTLISTMPHIPDMKEKTLRYPGHSSLIRALKEAGFFGEQTIQIGGVEVRPVDVTSKILIDEWKLDPAEPEFTVMRVTVSGSEEGRDVTYTYDLYDEFDSETGFSSMARTTGFTCTAMVNYLLDHGIAEAGIYPLELIGRMVGGFGFTLKHLTKRGVSLKGRKY